VAEFGSLHQHNLSALQGGGFRLSSGELRIEMDHELFGALVIDTPETGEHGSGSGAAESGGQRRHFTSIGISVTESGFASNTSANESRVGP
jgi:hypothetical protein